MGGSVICAEAGVNHHGLLTLALELVDAAKAAGADLVKFQTFDCDALLRKNDPSHDQLLELELSHPEFIVLARHCERVGIEFMSTPGDLDSLRFIVEELGVKRIKIGSDDLTYTPLLESAAATKLPIILSTGMASIKEIDAALAIVGDATLLHCVSLYPCPIELANIGAITTMRQTFRHPIGYSDHTGNFLACYMAVTLGATMVEAHLMLDNDNPIDENVSYNTHDFIFMIKRIRLIEKLLGSGIKAPCAEELAVAGSLRKDQDGRRGLAA